MLCDGINDCPDSEDELLCPSWVDIGGYLSCKDDSIRVHPHEVCDGVVHCLLHQDDEYLCDYSCPKYCHCKGYTMSCKLNKTVSYHWREICRLKYILPLATYVVKT